MNTPTTKRTEFPCDFESCDFAAHSAEELSAHKAREHRPRYRITTIEFPLKLPGGYIDESGRLHAEIELAPFTGVEEDLLSDSRLARDGEHVRRILANCLTRVGDYHFPYEGRTPDQRAQVTRIVNNMLWLDKTFATVMLRRISVRNGNIYRFRTECPNSDCKYGPDDNRPAERLDLGTLDVFPVPDPMTRVFTKRLSGSQKLVRFRHLLTSDEPEIIDLRRKYEKKYMSAQLWLQILDVDGSQVKTPDDLRRWSASDRDELRVAMEDLGGGLDLNISTECPRCKHVDRGPMQIGAPFFIPSLAGF